MDLTEEQHLSIDHFEEKFVTYSPVLTRANDQQDASGHKAVRDDGAEGAMEEAGAEMENNVNNTDEGLPLEKSEQNILSTEVDSAQGVAKENIEIIMGVNQTIEVDLFAKETNQQQMNAQDLNPKSPQKSELNLFLASEETSVDQPMNVILTDTNVASVVESELIPNEVGLLADKQQVLNVDIGWKEVISDDSLNEECQLNLVVEAPPMVTAEMATKEFGMKPSTENIKDVGMKEDQVGTDNLNTILKSEIEKPSDPIDIEAQQATEVGSKDETPTTIFVKNPEVIQKEERAVSESAVLQSHPIEVERTFQVTNFDEDTLFQANGKLVSEASFEDVYYDNNSYDLILKDCWLRKRNRKWEFKIPVNMDPSLLYMSTQFKELEDEKDIKSALLEIIKPEDKFSENQGIIEEFKLEPFATFTTMRKSYQLPFDCKVVIDFTGFGYSVGEIEIMVKDNSEIAEAVERINTIADQLGFKMLSITELAKC